MAVAFQAVGPSVAGTGSTFTLTSPVLAADDVMIAVLLSKNNEVVTVPSGWTKFVEANNTVNQRLTLAWKRAVAADSEAAFSFTIASGTLRGVIAVYRGCNVTGATPIDVASPTVSANVTADAVTYATFDPAETAAFVVAVGVYNLNGTTAGVIAGTDPTFTNNWDLEGGASPTASLFGYSGASTGAITGARSHSTTSATDDISIGVLFGLVAATVPATVTGLTAAARTDKRIDLSWTAPADGGSPILGYSVVRETPVGGGFVVRQLRTIGGAEGKAYFDTSVLPSTQYNYSLKAENALGFSAAFSIAANAATSATTFLSGARMKSVIEGET